MTLYVIVMYIIIFYSELLDFNNECVDILM